MDPFSNLLAAEARDRIRRNSSQGAHSRVMRAEIEIPRLDALAWLRVQKRTPKVYWSDRERSGEVAAFGAVDELVSEDAENLRHLFARMEERLENSDSAVRYYGGLCFANSGVREPVWLRFGYARFVMPRFELVSTAARSTLACHWVDSAQDAESLFDELDFLRGGLGAADRGEFAATGRSDLPDVSQWRNEVDATLSRLSGEELEKLVLARRSVFDCTRELDPLAFLQALSARADRCYRFCFMPAAEVGFLGLSPERLYRREERRILTEAIAGTRARGVELSDDVDLERELTESGKERREHAYVVRGVKESLAPLCETLHMSRGVSVLKLQECQHLMSIFDGRLRDHIGDLDVLKALQPTPAVGGYPAEVAVRELTRIEPFDRGWYAGPIGWVGRTGAEFAVAIRSGLVERKKLTVYAGAGIVQGSAADEEWQELDNKIRHFTRMLNLSC